MVASVKVFKKSSPNGKVTVYLGKRDYVDHLDHVDPIEGVVVVENDYLKGRKVFGQVATNNTIHSFFFSCATSYSPAFFNDWQINVTVRYGREEDEVMGVKFVKELTLISEQIVPKRGSEKSLCPLQVASLNLNQSNQRINQLTIKPYIKYI